MSRKAHKAAKAANRRPPELARMALSEVSELTHGSRHFRYSFRQLRVIIVSEIFTGFRIHPAATRRKVSESNVGTTLADFKPTCKCQHRMAAGALLGEEDMVALGRACGATNPIDCNGVRIAVVGCGYWGSKHVRVLHSLPNLLEVVIIDPDPGVRTAMMSTFRGLRAFANLDSALPFVDAVIIATPPQTHARLAMQALQSGKHVLVEKPLANSVTESQMLIHEARRSNKLLMVGHTFLFSSPVRELRERLARGELGKIHYIHSARLNLGLYRPDVNVIWDLAPHDITIANYLLQDVPTTVSAWGASFACRRVEDVAYVRLDYDTLEVSAYIHISWLHPNKTRTVTVVGERRMAVYDDLADEPLRIYDRGVEGFSDGAPPFERPLSYRYGDILSPHIRLAEPLSVEDQHFIDCIENGAIPESDGQSGLSVVAVLEAIERAIHLRTTVEVAYSHHAYHGARTSNLPHAAK